MARFSRAYGTGLVTGLGPAAEAAGYYQRSLRDRVGIHE